MMNIHQMPLKILTCQVAFHDVEVDVVMFIEVQSIVAVVVAIDEG